MNALPTSLLQRLLERPAPFALLYRPESNGPGLLDVIAARRSNCTAWPTCRWTSPARACRAMTCWR